MPPADSFFEDFFGAPSLEALEGVEGVEGVEEDVSVSLTVFVSEYHRDCGKGEDRRQTHAVAIRWGQNDDDDRPRALRIDQAP